MATDQYRVKKAWKEYAKAIKEFGLDDIEDGWHSKENPRGYMYDAFFAGYYTGRDDYKVYDDTILDILDTIKLGQVGWEGNEDVMTFNGKPIGGTISRNIEIDRWWTSLKKHIANYIFDKLNKRK